jgi:predicted glycosyltransferase
VPPSPRVLFYTHDSYGIGHLRRSLVLSRFLAARWPAAPQVIVTGSPVAQSLLRPGDAPHVVLPPVIKVGPGRYEARDPGRSLDAVMARREEILLDAATAFAPDIVVVDHAPAGLLGELRGVLARRGRGPRPSRFVLSLRDVVDNPEVVRTIWAREGVYDLLDHVYDLIVVHGWPGAHDVAAEYGLSPVAAARVRYLGYPRRERDAAAPAAAGPPTEGTPLVVVTAGSGQDGALLLGPMADAVRRWPERARFTAVLVEGPLMPEADRRRVRSLAAGLPNLGVLEQVDDMVALIARATVVVSMAGFNTVCEILSCERPALLVPRAERSDEQRIRARMLEARGLVRVMDVSALTPAALLAAVLDLLAHPGCLRPPPPLDGLPAFVEALASLPGVAD